MTLSAAHVEIGLNRHTISDPFKGQEARERRGIAHRDVVQPGGAVRHAGERDEVLVDVVGPLDAVEDRVEVLDLRLAPPRRVAPPGRPDVNLLGALEHRTASAAAAAGAGLAGLAHHHAAVQLEAELVLPRRIVGLRHVQVIVELAQRRAPLEADAAPLHLRRVAAPSLQPRERIVERDRQADDGLRRLRRILRIVRAPELLERGIDGRRRRGRHQESRRHRDARKDDQRRPCCHAATY